MDDPMNGEEQARPFLAPSPGYLASIKVFPLIPNLKRDVTDSIDSALSWEQLTASDINFALVRPLVFKYAKLNNLSVVYIALVVRSHFLSLADDDLAYSGVQLSRASLCEILAMKLLATFSGERIQLVSVLTTYWTPLAGAPEDIIEEVRAILGGDDAYDPQSALEMAIATKAKMFLSAPVVQTVVDDIYSGRVVFSTTSHRSVLADNYKQKAITIYDCHKAPILDHYRLRVPRYANILEFLDIAILLCTFVICLSNQNAQHVAPSEIVFVLFALAFTLAEYTASKEHGWSIYIANMWNAFDTAFILVFFAYGVLRIKGLANGDAQLSEMAFDILACGACILFPRLAFFAIRHNIVVIALRGMISEFVFFISIAAICFSGLVFTLHNLAGDKWKVPSIVWLMVQIWFGNTYLSFGQAYSFHPIFGPVLMTGFAALANTLLLTILISILSNTFARINANATQEYLFQFAISTIEGVKSDALFSYQPPFNLLAFVILWPASWFLSPRSLHRANVFLIRLTSFPILIMISMYERHCAAGKGLRESSKNAVQMVFNSFPRNVKRLPFLDTFMGTKASDVYDAIFDIDLSDHDFGDIFGESEDDFPALQSFPSRETVLRPRMSPRRPPSSVRSPVRDSSSPPASPITRRRAVSALPPMIQTSSSAEVPPAGKASPLSKLFGTRRQLAVSQPNFQAAIAANETLESGIKRIEALVEDVREMPVNKLKQEMKELQERQARIEGLLLMLTRGMRNETVSSSQ